MPWILIQDLSLRSPELPGLDLHEFPEHPVEMGRIAIPHQKGDLGDALITFDQEARGLLDPDLI